jgi:hypothetical protein
MQWAAVQMARRELFQGLKKILWLMVRLLMQPVAQVVQPVAQVV